MSQPSNKIYVHSVLSFEVVESFIKQKTKQKTKATLATDFRCSF